MGLGNFELQWDDFQDNLATCFRDLREEGDLFDVTLACDDDQVEAHKVILSSSSAFFKSIIKRNPHVHPLIYLKGVKIKNLTSLLDFMYLGKTRIAQDKVETFLKLGEELGVKGLVRNELGLPDANTEKEELIASKNLKECENKIDPLSEEVNQTENFLEYDALVEKARIWQKKTKTNSNINDVKKEDKLLDIIDTENDESLLYNENDEEVFDNSITKRSAEVRIDPESKAKIENLISKAVNDSGEVGWQCTECNKYSKEKGNLKKHIEIHLGFSFSCKYCSGVYKTRNTLNHHMFTSKPCRASKTKGQ